MTSGAAAAAGGAAAALPLPAAATAAAAVVTLRTGCRALPAAGVPACSPFGLRPAPSSSHPAPLQIGFFALLLVEFLANKGLLDMLGFTTGKGLGFEF